MVQQSAFIDIIPARRVLDEAIATNDRLGHDNLGSLSYSHGFLPRQEPLKALPDSHRVWDEIAGSLPHLFRTYAVRKVLDEMPLLSAEETELPDHDLLRASSLFSILAHLYWYSEPEPPEQDIPLQIQQPWEQITRRLDRPAPNLSFIDLNSHNWYFMDPTLEQPFVMENLKLAIPLIGNEDERRFQMTPVEMLYLFSPLMEMMLTAQEAVVQDDAEKLKRSLVSISDALKTLTYISLQKVNPNPYSDTYINPVVWGKTAALFASPFQKESIPGPSGTAIPSFTALDIFFGRKRYKTTVGHETDRTRNWFPKHWREWLTALEAISVTDYVMNKEDRTLVGIYEEARDAYAGDSSLLNRHKLKAYGFLDLSFKAGRMKTLGGVSGSYSERVWDRMATELDEARLERYGAFPQTTHMVPVKRVDTIGSSEHTSVQRIVFDIAGTGIRYQAGDRCGILPENSDELVEKTLAALHAHGNEVVQLNTNWRWHINLRYGYQNATEVPLRILLKFGRIRPVDRSVALMLYSITNNERLRKILDSWAEDQWELWDMLAMLSEAGYNPRRLLKATPGDYEHICRIVAPERWRLYSISSTLDAYPDELHLSVGGLRYKTSDTDISHGTDRWGTGSRFLADLSTVSNFVSIKVVHPPRFSLPADTSRPVVMFAGGTGIAPMRSLIDERIKDQNAGATWLFFGTRHREDFYYQDEFEPYIAADQLNVRVAFSREDVAARFNDETQQFDFVAGTRMHLNQEMLKEENARLLWELLCSIRDGGQGAYFYLCGRTAFANTVLDAIKQIIVRYTAGATDQEREATASDTLYRLIGEDRLMLEIFTTYDGAHYEEQKRQYNISEVALHNDDEHGYWIIINGRVYDMNAFNHIHPGGAKIIQSYAGMDGTIAYQKVEHHINPEVDAMLGMYALGVVRTLNFGEVWSVAVSDKGLRLITLRDAYHAWIDMLYMIIEIENAIQNDFRIRGEPFTDIETQEQIFLTPTKVQQIGWTHERLVTGYLDHILGEPMQTLWALTVGLADRKELDMRWMQHQIESVKSTEQSKAVIELAHMLREVIKRDDQRLNASPVYFEEQFGALCDLIESQDRRLMRQLKLAILQGVIAFEDFEQYTTTLGSEQLVSALQSIPFILEDFYGSVVVELPL